MSIKELKKEIEKILGNIPEDNLPDVLEFLKSMQSNTSENTISLSGSLDKVLTEDKELLKKLAQ